LSHPCEKEHMKVSTGMKRGNMLYKCYDSSVLITYNHVIISQGG
jgi:hypothetical protein